MHATRLVTWDYFPTQDGAETAISLLNLTL